MFFLNVQIGLKRVLRRKEENIHWGFYFLKNEAIVVYEATVGRMKMR